MPGICLGEAWTLTWPGYLAHLKGTATVASAHSLSLVELSWLLTDIPGWEGIGQTLVGGGWFRTKG